MHHGSLYEESLAYLMITDDLSEPFLELCTLPLKGLAYIVGSQHRRSEASVGRLCSDKCVLCEGNCRY
jgi:hypothetical protein